LEYGELIGVSTVPSMDVAYCGMARQLRRNELAIGLAIEAAYGLVASPMELTYYGTWSINSCGIWVLELTNPRKQRRIP